MKPFLALFAIAALAAAQDDVPTFRTGARLVELSVTVTGRDGQPVTDLTRDDFTLTDRRQKRDIAFFRYEGAPQPVAPRTLDPGHFSNRTELLGEQPRNVIALLIDALNTRPEDQAQVQLQLLRYLRDVAPETRIAIYRFGHELSVLHDFTTDATLLREAISKTLVTLPLQPEADISKAAIEAGRFIESLPRTSIAIRMMTLFHRSRIESDQAANAAAQQDRAQRTLDALDAVGRHLAGIPGRKSLLWITGGIPMFTQTGDAGRGPRGDSTSLESRITSTGRRLAQHNVALYIVEAGGLDIQGAFDLDAIHEASTPRRRTFYSQAETARASTNPGSALGLLATVTGGRHFASGNDRLQGYRYALDDQRGAYTIAFYAPEDRGNRWNDVRVQVRQPGARALHRQGYWSSPSGLPRSTWSRQDWDAALRNPLGSSQIRLSARISARGGALSLALAIHAADLNIKDGAGGFDICIADRASGIFHPYYQTGQFSLDPAQLTRAYAQGLGFQRTWTPEPGTTSIRILVRDRATGLYGSLDVPLDEVPGA